MPVSRVIKPVPYAAEIVKLRQIYLRAEEQLIGVIGYKRSRGYVDYAEVASLERVQRILQKMIDDSWTYVPKAIESQYKMGKVREVGYENARVLTSTETDVVNRLTHNLMGTITEAAATVSRNISTAWDESVTIGRLSPDLYRESVLEGLAQGEVAGSGIRTAKNLFLEKMQEQGIVAFEDASGRQWSLSSYANMATRTTSRQAVNLSVLFSDEEHDLYQISSRGTTCPICAPLEGRVYSKSGTHPVYPPLALAFGKINASGGNGLDNSYLNIHPNCLHVLTKFTEEGRTDEEIERIQQFSSFETNPRSVDPRSQAQIDAYRNKEQDRAKLLNEFRQFENYKMVLGENFPKTFQTFKRHKSENSDKYLGWKEDYREINRKIKQSGG